MNKLFSFSSFLPSARRADKKISLSFKISFADRLSFLLNSNIPLLESLRILESQTKDRNKRHFFGRISKEISSGKSFSDAVSPFLDVFSVSIIQVGEKSGQLGSGLGFLSTELKKKREIRKKVLQALIYPSIVALATFGIVIFLLAFIFPKILPVITGLNISLPLTTRLVIGVSNFFADFWLALFLIIIFIIAIFSLFFHKNQKFRFLFSKILLSIPLWKNFYQDFLMANFCRSLGLLLKSGLTIDKALESVGQSSSNIFFQQKIFEIKIAVCGGRKLSGFLADCPEIFPVALSEMVAVGERTGNLHEVLAGLSEYHDVQFSEKVRNFSIFIEPALLIFAGLVVGLVAVSIIAPVYEITNALQKR